MVVSAMEPKLLMKMLQETLTGGPAGGNTHQTEQHVSPKHNLNSATFAGGSVGVSGRIYFLLLILFYQMSRLGAASHSLHLSGEQKLYSRDCWRLLAGAGPSLVAKPSEHLENS